MENFVVSARKYRPQTFEDVVGQHAITNTLENAIKNNHLAQALLFTGPRGVGKTTCARILAKKINQTENDTDDEDFAFNIFELDAASNNSVDDIRSLTDQVRIPPQTGKYKVYIIDEVHMLSTSAFNAFLKTLEEPPAHAIFILATTEKHKIIPTILSRCQIFDFKRIRVVDAKNYLKKIAAKEQIDAEDDALHIIAQKADGAMRDALSIFDRVVSFSGAKITRKDVSENLNVLDYDEFFKATELLLTNKIPDVLLHFNSILSKGFEGINFINGLASHFRDLLVAKDHKTIELLEVGDTVKKAYIEQSEKCDLLFLMEALQLTNQCDLNYRTSKNQRLLVELTLMQIASITFDGEKKNNKPYIIAAVHFQHKRKRTKASSSISAEKQVVKEIVKQEAITPKNEIVKPPKLERVARKKSSSFSLSSVERENEIKETEVSYEEVDGLPADSFTEIDVIKHWKVFAENLYEKGKMSAASIMNSGTPTLKDSTIEFVVPSKIMKDQLNVNRLLKYLKESLNNFKIEINVVVNETKAKKFAYTPEEKYQKMKEMNPLIEEFKKKFDLEL